MSNSNIIKIDIQPRVEISLAVVLDVGVTKPIFSSDINKRIDDVWTILTEGRTDLFEGKLLRVTKVQNIQNAQTEITVASDITYKEIVGLRYGDGVNTSGLEKEIDIQALSAYIFVYTIDGHIFLIDRESGDFRIALEFPGGFIQEKHQIKNVEDFVYRKVHSDTGIDAAYLSDAYCHGYLDARYIFELVLVYSVKCNLTFDEVREKATVKIYDIPAEYSSDMHSSFFDKKIYSIMKYTLDGFLSVVRGSLN